MESHRVIAEIQTTKECRELREGTVIGKVLVGDQKQPVILALNETFHVLAQILGKKREHPWPEQIVKLVAFINARVRNNGCFEAFDGKMILIRDPAETCVIRAIEELVQRMSDRMATVIILENTSRSGA